MANQPNWNPNSEEYLYNTTELLDAIFQEEDIYPWNPTTPEAEAYFADSERDFSLTNSLDSTEIESLAETFFSHLNQCWNSSASSRLQESLAVKFGQLVPEDLRSQVIARAEEICTAPISLMNQLLQCVQPLLANWGEEDLEVFARPLVYAMRSSPARVTEIEKKFVPQAPWNQLSQIQKARCTIAMAHFALLQLQGEQEL